MRGTFEAIELNQSHCYIRWTDVAKTQRSSKQRMKMKFKTLKSISSKIFLLTVQLKTLFSRARDGVSYLHWVVSPIDGKISAAGVGSLSRAQYIKNNYHLAVTHCEGDFLN